LVIISSFQQLLAYFIFPAVVFLAVTGAGLFIARLRSAERKPEFLTPVYPVPTIIFLTFMALFLLLLAVHNWREAVIGTIVVLGGVPVYFLGNSEFLVGRPAESLGDAKAQKRR
jgi:amino acid transporter